VVGEVPGVKDYGVVARGCHVLGLVQVERHHGPQLRVLAVRAQLHQQHRSAFPHMLSEVACCNEEAKMQSDWRTATI
jgi:hypothetical protein